MKTFAALHSAVDVWTEETLDFLAVLSLTVTSTSMGALSCVRAQACVKHAYCNLSNH